MPAACSTGGTCSCSFCHSVALSALGSHHLEYPRVHGLIRERHQLGQLHRAGCSFPVLTREGHLKPNISSATATTHTSPGRLHLEPSPAYSKLVPSPRLPKPTPSSLPRTAWRFRGMEAARKPRHFHASALYLCTARSQPTEPRGLSVGMPFHQERC